MDTNRTFENNSGLPTYPLNDISQHVDEAGKSSAQNQQLELPLTVSKINYEITSNYDKPSYNKPVYQGECSLTKNVLPSKNDELCPGVTSGDVYAQVFKQDNSIQLASVQAKNHHDGRPMVMELINSMDNSECNNDVCYVKLKLA